jgi:hypothetical protein
MAAPEMTAEKKNDLMVLHMRKALDPKRFYKNNDTLSLPKYFQVIVVFVQLTISYFDSKIICSQELYPFKKIKNTIMTKLRNINFTISIP